MNIILKKGCVNMYDKQFNTIQDMINIFEKHKITKIEAIGIMEVVKYNLLKGDI